ncbi:MAG TPA: hypothetical protein ENK59_05390 [Thioploca sp.]|nr:hypothetical protein [Thioploca sp.]
MRYNKTLGVAIAAILSGGIGLTAQAGELYVGKFADLSPFTSEPAATPIASEGVGDDGSTDKVGSVDTVFEFERKSTIIYNVYVDYTLTGATFNTVNSPTLENMDENANTAAITRISGGADSNTVRYLLQGGKNNIRTDIETGNVFEADQKEDALEFSFTIKDTEGLADNGGTVKLKAEWGEAKVDFKVEDSSIQTLYQSKAAVNAVITAKDPAAKVDVTEGSKKFVDGYSATAITLGTIKITDDDSYRIANNDVTGSLVVTGGPFAASTGENQVFLDIDLTNGNCVFTDNTDDLAAVVDGNEATFKLEATHVNGLALNAVDVCVVVDENNETNINNTKDRATVALTLSYPSDKEITYVGRLAQTKRNGTACTLYNIPHKQASDLGFYRFINKTDADATVWGTLKDRDAKEYFVDQELGTVSANSTLVVRSTELHDYAVAAGANEEKPWVGRAILTINSNSTDMEAYALLRGKNTRSVLLPAGATTPPANIGPLINVSLGASGNGCD